MGSFWRIFPAAKLHNGGTDVTEDASGPGPGNQYNVKTPVEFQISLLNGLVRTVLLLQQ